MVQPARRAALHGQIQTEGRDRPVLGTHRDGTDTTPDGHRHRRTAPHAGIRAQASSTRDRDGGRTRSGGCVCERRRCAAEPAHATVNGQPLGEDRDRAAGGLRVPADAFPRGRTAVRTARRRRPSIAWHHDRGGTSGVGAVTSRSGRTGSPRTPWCRPPRHRSPRCTARGCRTPRRTRRRRSGGRPWRSPWTRCRR